MADLEGSDESLKTQSPKISAEVFAIPLDADRFLIYAPGRRAAFVGNSAIVNRLADLNEGTANLISTASDEQLLEFLRRLEIVDAGPEPFPITSFQGEPEPVSLTLFLTTACNLRCTYCYASAGDTPASFMSPATVPTSGGRIGVLLVNLGTPDATDYWSMRRYLKEFLSDRRVIEENRIKWWLVLNLIILTVRPGRKGRDYDKIWNKQRNESPLKTVTRSQSDKLEEMLGKIDKRIRVDWAMRYGNPSISSRLEALAAQDCERILLVPLYPQYAAATTATVCDDAFRALARMRLQPSLRVAAPYYAEPVYIDALTNSLNAALASLP